VLCAVNFKTMKHKKQEKNGWVRGMYKPEKAGQYLIEDINGKSVAEYDGEFWEEKVSHLLCWTFIHPHEIDAPF
jgi:hypothetical protein